MHVLILGGTTEASLLAHRLARAAEFQPVLSLAGRTQQPASAPIPIRIGGFGGVEGLVAYLRRETIEAVVDATHPFAARMSANAVAACSEAGVPLITFSRPPWRAVAGDRWIDAAGAVDAALHLGDDRQRVFLAVGRLSVPAFAAAPQHFYLVRSIDAADAQSVLPSSREIHARGPFSVEDETALLREERIDIVVSKNSGGAATYAKIEAARNLGLPVVMIARPKPAGTEALGDVDAVLEWLRAHRRSP